MTAPRIVVDASVILAFVFNETGADRAEEMLFGGAAISTLNWSEALAKIADTEAGTPRAHDRALRRRGAMEFVSVRPFSRAQAIEAATLRPATRARGLGLGDRACLALARVLALPVGTADRAWARLDAKIVGVSIELIR